MHDAVWSAYTSWTSGRAAQEEEEHDKLDERKKYLVEHTWWAASPRDALEELLEQPSFIPPGPQGKLRELVQAAIDAAEDQERKHEEQIEALRDQIARLEERVAPIPRRRRKTE